MGHTLAHGLAWPGTACLGARCGGAQRWGAGCCGLFVEVAGGGRRVEWPRAAQPWPSHGQPGRRCFWAGAGWSLRPRAAQHTEVRGGCGGEGVIPAEMELPGRGAPRAPRAPVALRGPRQPAAGWRGNYTRAAGIAKKKRRMPRRGAGRVEQRATCCAAAFPAAFTLGRLRHQNPQ